MKLEVASLTDPGQVRPNNEDAFGHFGPSNDEERARMGWLFVVADGMGGHRGGEIASALAVKTINTVYYSDKSADRLAALKIAVEEANRLILDQAIADPSLAGMGTTCTAMAVHDGFAYFVHVGDSRAYVLRDGELVQLTQDHSLVGEMVRSGILSDEDARNHPKRNVITRSLGVQSVVATDTPFTPFKLERGDVFVLCSDGLTSVVKDEEIAGAVGGNRPSEATNVLVRLANDRGGKDNITVVVVNVTEV
jgi:serine/threonine protein phosphatase PrpC